MKTKYSKEEFDRLFPRGIMQSKENMRRLAANQYLVKGCSLEETYQLVHKQIPWGFTFRTTELLDC